MRTVPRVKVVVAGAAVDTVAAEEAVVVGAAGAEDMVAVAAGAETVASAAAGTAIKPGFPRFSLL